jgi:hypothetical protein
MASTSKTAAMLTTKATAGAMCSVVKDKPDKNEQQAYGD